MAEGQFPGSLWMPTTKFGQGRSSHDVRWIIIHGTAWPGPAAAQDIGRFFQHPDRDTSTHFTIDKAGVIVQSVKVEDTAWGNGIVTAGHDPWWGGRNGNPNFSTVSIEHVKWGGKTHNDEGLTGSQWEASYHLITWLCNRFPKIKRAPADESGGITGHFSIDPINKKYCPGPYPWNELFSILNTPESPSGFGPIARVPGPFYGIGEGVSSTASISAPSVGAGETGPKRGGLAVLSSNTLQKSLADLPGFASIVGTVDRVEQFQGFDSSHIGSSFVANGSALTVRAVLILIGFLLAILLILALARGNSWIGEAGVDVLPLMRQTNTGQQRIATFESRNTT